MLRRTAVRLSAASKASPLWKTTNPGGQFSVAGDSGFRANHRPLAKLPAEYKELEEILGAMSINNPDGSHGLLSRGDFGPAIDNGLPLYDVTKVEDPALVAALFRDYSMATSAYSLETTHLGVISKGADVGAKVRVGPRSPARYSPPRSPQARRTQMPARGTIPKQLAIPLDYLANKVGSKPWLDYAYGYALNNWTLKDESADFSLENIKCVRLFEGGPDEDGFILVHVAMVHESGNLTNAQQAVIAAAAEKNEEKLTLALNDLAESLGKIYSLFTRMWKHSKPCVDRAPALRCLLRVATLPLPHPPSSLPPVLPGMRTSPSAPSSWARPATPTRTRTGSRSKASATSSRAISAARRGRRTR
jgi:indoleamine 2,3-dioxygenase